MKLSKLDSVSVNQKLLTNSSSIRIHLNISLSEFKELPFDDVLSFCEEVFND
jgi:hypothetical protein